MNCLLRVRSRVTLPIERSKGMDAKILKLFFGPNSIIAKRRKDKLFLARLYHLTSF